MLKCELPNKLDRAIDAKAARLLDAKLLRAWATAVKDRDQWKDRKSGVKVYRTRALDPLRAEAHHVVAKDDQAVRYDVRNGICLSLASHFLVETHVWRIVGTVFFTVGGRTYIDATYEVSFERE
jgi:hypothetical protein